MFGGKVTKKQKHLPPIWWVHIGGILVVEKGLLSADALEFRCYGGYLVHNHAFPFLGRLLGAIDVLRHQTLTDTQPSPNGSSFNVLRLDSLILHKHDTFGQNVKLGFSVGTLNHVRE